MSQFRVIIRTPGGEVVRAISNVVDFVQASSFATFMRSRGHQAEIVVNDRAWTAHAGQLAATQPTTLFLQAVPGNTDAIAGELDQGAGDGK